MRPSLALTLLLLLGPAAARPQEAPAPPKGRMVHDEWVVLLIQGRRVGWEHETTWAVPDGQGERFVTSSESEMTTLFDGETTRERSRETEEADSGGRLLRFESRTLQSAIETIVTGEVRGRTLAVEISTAGETRASSQPWGPDILGSWGERRIAKEKGVAPGTAYQYLLFSSDSLTAGEISVKVLGKETVDLLGQPRELVRVEQTDSEQPGLTLVGWVDESAQMLKAEIPVMGGFTLVVVSKEVALAELSGPAPDLLDSACVPVDVPLPHPSRLVSATYVISAETGTLEGWKIAEGRQKVLARDATSLTLQVESTVPAAAETLPVKDPAMAEFLEPNSWLQADDAGIRARVKEAVADEVDAWKAAKRLEGWVYDNIQDKNYQISFATAKEVCDTLAGDCTEHAVLLAAMARAAGLPSRVASGLLYYEGVFGGHMWTEVHVAGGWHALDATMPGERVDAAHITFDTSSLQHETPTKAMMNATGYIDRLRVSVRRLDYGARVIDLGDGFRPHSVDGEVFHHALFGFRVTRPAGWSFHPWAGGVRKPALVLRPPGGGDGIALECDFYDVAVPLEMLKRGLRGDAPGRDEQEWKVQGRAAWSCRMRRPDGAVTASVAVVVDGDMAITVHHQGGNAEGAKAWESVVAGLAFDE